jgi:POT family proton-dependent oligopeptide transporter
LNLFAADFTDRQVGGFEVPATWFQSVNSLFIILLAPAFAALWVTLARRRGDLSSPAKFSLGLFLAGIGFLLMIWAANIILEGGPGTLVSPWWLVGSYFFQTLGELALSPVGLSSMTKLSPRKYVGQMMGIWFLATAVGNLIAGLAGGHVDPSKLEQMPKLFTVTTIFLMVSAVVLALLIVPIRRMMATTKGTL